MSNSEMGQMISAEDFKNEVRAWADEIGVAVKEIHLRYMKRKWASCSSRGRLTFDLKLLEKQKENRAEVIIHELLHLKYPNHGRMFKSMLNVYLNKVKTIVRS